MYEHLDQIENEFKEIHEENNKDEKDPKIQQIYKNNLFLYLAYIILPLILSVVVILALRGNPFFFQNVNPSEHAITNATSDVNGLLIVNPEQFEGLDSLYQSFLIPVGSDGQSTIYVHSAASFITNTDFFSKPTDDPVTYLINHDVFLDILNGTITHWPNHAKITFYVPYDDVSPNVAGSIIDDIKILTGSSSIPTMALNALFSFVVMLVIAVPMIIISIPVIGKDLQFLQTDNENVGTILSKAGIGILYMFAANVVVNILITGISKLFMIPDQLSANQLSINLMLKSPYFILMVITAVLIGPIVEELVFRKSFFGLIKNEKYALIISSIVFGLIHISTEILSGDLGIILISGLPYIAGGFVFGYVYMINKKNIIIPIIAHMLYNLISVIISIFLFFNI